MPLMACSARSKVRNEGIGAAGGIDGSNCLTVGRGGTTQSQQDLGTQFTVALPQHFLYFFPDPQGHGSFRPTLGALHRGSDVRAVASACRCFRKYRYAPKSPAAMCTMTSSRFSGLIGSGRISGSVSCS